MSGLVGGITKSTDGGTQPLMLSGPSSECAAATACACAARARSARCAAASSASAVVKQMWQGAIDVLAAQNHGAESRCASRLVIRCSRSGVSFGLGRGGTGGGRGPFPGAGSTGGPSGGGEPSGSLTGAGARCADVYFTSACCQEAAPCSNTETSASILLLYSCAQRLTLTSNSNLAMLVLSSSWIWWA